jgi:hypothetical protein
MSVPGSGVLYVTASVLSYDYLRPSAVRESGASRTLALETSGGAAPAGAVAHPRLFDGFLTAPTAAAAAILAVADVAAARFDQSASGSLDPVVTAGGGLTLAGALCERLPGHVTADEPYYLLEEEGYDFTFPPSLEDYRALLARSLQSLISSPLLPGIVFDRTPLDYLAYLAAIGADPADEAGAAALQLAFASLDLLVITPITPETEQVLPPAEMPGLRSEMNDALVELVHDDPLNAWADIPVLELDGPLDARLGAVLAALDQAGHPRPPGRNASVPADRAVAP